MSDSERVESSNAGGSDEEDEGSQKDMQWLCKKCPDKVIKSVKAMEKHRQYHRDKRRIDREAQRSINTSFPPTPESEESRESPTTTTNDPSSPRYPQRVRNGPEEESWAEGRSMTAAERKRRAVRKHVDGIQKKTRYKNG